MQREGGIFVFVLSFSSFVLESSFVSLKRDKTRSARTTYEPRRQVSFGFLCSYAAEIVLNFRCFFFSLSLSVCVPLCVLFHAVSLPLGVRDKGPDTLVNTTKASLGCAGEGKSFKISLRLTFPCLVRCHFFPLRRGVRVKKVRHNLERNTRVVP